MSESDVYRRQIPTSEADPRTVRVKALKYFHINQETKGFFQFEVIINILVSFHIKTCFRIHQSKHKAWSQCWFNVGPAS